MMRLVVRVLGVVDSISDWSGKIIGWLLIILSLILVYAVLMRYGFNKPPSWAHETALFMYGGVAVLTGAYVLRHKGHIRMDIFYNRFSPRKKAIMNIICAPLFFGFMAILVWQGLDMTDYAIKHSQVTNSMWHPITWPAKLAMPLGGFLLLMQGTADFIRDLYLAIRGRSIG